jgi:hypothetical protein
MCAGTVSCRIAASTSFAFNGIKLESEMSPRLSGRLLCVPSVRNSHFRRLETLRPPILRQSLRNAAEQTRSLQLVIGKLERFAALVRDRLEDADWNTRRDLIVTLVRRIEVDDQHVRVVFRVGSEPPDGTGSRQISHLCPGRGLGI